MRGLGMRKPLHAAVVTALNTPNTLFANGEQGAWFEPWAQNALAERRNLLNHSQDLTNAAWTKQSATATVESTVPAPNGTLTANRINVTSAGNAAIIKQNVAVSGAKLRTFSVHVRTGNSTDTGVLFEAYAASSYNDFSVVFDTATGAFTQAAGWLNSTNGVDLKDLGWAYGSVPLANGWYRVWVTMPVVNEVYTVGVWAFSPTAAKYMLAWGVQVENGPLSDYQSVVTWTEAEKMEWMQRNHANQLTLFQDSVGATPVTAMEQPVGLILDKRLGLTRGAEVLTNPGPNFVSLSGWQSQSATATLSVENGAIVATRVNGASSWVIQSPTVPLVAGKTYEFIAEVASPEAYAISFSVYDNTAAASIGGSGTGSAITTRNTIRCILRANSTGTHLVNLQQNAAAPNGTRCIMYSCSVRELSGNHASQPTTTGRPVLSARSNLTVKSEVFADAAWTKFSATMLDNNTTAPNGTLTASKLAEDNTLNIHAVGRGGMLGQSSAGTTFTGSYYFKAAERTMCAIAVGNGGLTSYARQFFDLSTGTVFGSMQVVGSVSGASASITAVGDGWYRCAITLTMTAAETSIGTFAYAATGSTINYQGVPGSGVYLWGAQLDYGPIATRYQRINSSTDYDWVGFPVYLKFDGVDDGLNVPGWDTLMDEAEPWFFASAITRVNMTANSWPRIIHRYLLGTPRQDVSVLLNPSSSFAIERYVNGSPEATVSQTLNTGVLSVLSGGYSRGGDSKIRGQNATLFAASTGSVGISSANIGSVAQSSTKIGYNTFDVRLYNLLLINRYPSDAEITQVHRNIANKTGAILA